MSLSKKILNFIHLSERIKNENRHSCTSSGKIESVAEHSWRTALMVILCHPHLEKKLILEKALMMAILHDIAEALIGDEHYFYTNENLQRKIYRKKKENEAMQKICSLLGVEGGEIKKLWEEFDNQKTYEARIVFALDQLEVCIQHNEADISTWNQEEKDKIFSYIDNIEAEDKFINQLKEQISKETLEKLKKI